MFPQAADPTLYQPTGQRNQQAPEGAGINPSALIALRASKYRTTIVNISVVHTRSHMGKIWPNGLNWPMDHPSLARQEK